MTTPRRGRFDNPLIKALTVRQPWADAIAYGTKRTENRTWNTAYRGRLLVHAGAGHDPTGRLAVTDRGALASWPDTRGAVIAAATLCGVHAAADGCCPEWGRPDVWHWTLTDVHRLEEPVPCRGALGLWTPPPAVHRAALNRLPPPEGVSA